MLRLKIKRNNLIHEMFENGYSQSQIAKELGVDPKTINNVIRRKSTPSVTLAAALAKLFGKEIPEIFEFEEIKK